MPYSTALEIPASTQKITSLHLATPACTCTLPTLLFRHKKKAIFSLLIFLIGSWCSSGTLSPYAATLPEPTVWSDCNYLVNIDNLLFQQFFFFLEGRPPHFYAGNPILRRILYPIIAYYPVKYFGYLEGGFITNLVVTILSVLLFAWYFARHIDLSDEKRTFPLLLLLFSTYPGISYWIGLPYSYATIVPCTLMGYILLDLARRKGSLRTTLLASLSIGILSISYDILPYFFPALLFLLLSKKRLRQIPLAAFLMMAPTALTLFILHIFYNIPLETSNSASYANIVKSYLNFPKFFPWLESIRGTPLVFYNNFLDSNFIALPTIFFICYIFGRFYLKMKFSRIEAVITLSLLSFFLFNNMAPPYDGWQMRGEWIARLYQPFFVVMVSYIARLYASSPKDSTSSRLTLLGCLIAFTFNAIVVFGPVTGIGPADRVYHNFYQHSPTPYRLYDNLRKYGKRPLGFCRKG